MDVESPHNAEEHPLKEELAETIAERDYYRHIAEQSGRTGLRSVHQLSRIIENLHHTEKALRDAQHTLEIKVAQRTAALAKANEELRKEIAERTKTEHELKESEERLRLALASARQGLYDLDLRTGVAKTNPEYALMLGYDPSTFEETNQKWIDRLHPDDRERVTAVYRSYINGEIPEYKVEFRQMTKAGGWKWILSLGKIVENDAEGRPLRMLGTHTDIGDRKHAEEERLEMERKLLHSQKLESLGVLAGGIAHDFNNLLLSILGNLDLALTKLPPVSPAREYLDRAIQAAHRSADLTAQMLAYSGKGTFVVQNIDLSELAEEMAPLLRSSLAKTVTLVTNLQRDIPNIDADAGQIQHLLINLITNASEAIGNTTGVITLSTGVQECDESCLQKSRLDERPAAGRFVYLEVSDTGSGMDAETQHHMFDPFYSTKAVGRGLGMSAILGIVRGHKGAILADSMRGQGTTIRVLFPLTTSSSAIASENAASGEVREGSCPMPNHGTILIVDDEEMVRKVCRAMVEHLGFSVLTAEDGNRAVEIFQTRSSEISCVLLDLSMPNKDGLATYEDIIRIKPDAKVILSTGFHEMEASNRFSAKGLAGFIQKPYRLATLRSTLHTIMG